MKTDLHVSNKNLQRCTFLLDHICLMTRSAAFEHSLVYKQNLLDMKKHMLY